jgi:hypothetical protein
MVEAPKGIMALRVKKTSEKKKKKI